MKLVAKLVIVDDQDQHLLLRLNNHPTFGNDYDVPGGTIDEGEAPIDACIREVDEEIGVKIDKAVVETLYEGTSYSKHDTHYSLFKVTLADRPSLTLSWEHTDYEWVSKQEFIQKSAAAKDTYMHMVAEKVDDRS